jgi:hypothetical protein
MDDTVIAVVVLYDSKQDGPSFIRTPKRIQVLLVPQGIKDFLRGFDHWPAEYSVPMQLDLSMYLANPAAQHLGIVYQTVAEQYEDFMRWTDGQKGYSKLHALGVCSKVVDFPIINPEMHVLHMKDGSLSERVLGLITNDQRRELGRREIVSFAMCMKQEDQV